MAMKPTTVAEKIGCAFGALCGVLALMLYVVTLLELLGLVHVWSIPVERAALFLILLYTGATYFHTKKR